MAKMRVYELARDLNLKNKDLLSKLNEMDIEVGSHMSSLDDETVAKVRSFLHGPREETIEITRIKPTVIRRRRKRVQPQEIEPEIATASTVTAEAEASSKTAEAVETNEVPADKPDMVVDETVKTKAPTPEAPEKDIEKEKATAAEPEKVEIDTATEEPIQIEKAKQKVAKPPKKKAKAKDAAKIIKLPTTPVKEKLQEAKAPTPKEEPATVTKLEPAKPAAQMDTPVKETAGKRKKKLRKKQEEVELDRKFFKKKISFKKKSIIEGKDLYAGGGRGRKGRKGAKNKAATKGQSTIITTPKAIKRRVKIDETIVLSELAKRMGIKASEMIAKLMGLGVMATVNQTIDFDTATLVAAEFNFDVERAAFEEETILKVETDDPDKLIPRPPVVTIMGHVDHGKTSLLDAIRKTRITEGEAGGITQHIGAYYVTTSKGQVVFLDTPGHEAFTAMRARGATITDIVVLVVAADDGVMPQTVEAINHAKASDVPIIVACNKIDKANAEPDKVYRQLAELGLAPEDWGGETIFVNVSAKNNTGIDDLLEMILLQAELLELKANPDKLAVGRVVEAKIDAGRGPVATILVQEGTLRNGDPVVCGIYHGKVRAMLNDRGAKMTDAGPSIPVELIGLSGVPMAGDEFIALSDEKDAKQVSLHRMQKQRSRELARSSRMSLEGLFEKMKEGQVKELNLIIKADVDGSIEALRDSLTKLSNEEVKINIVHSATGTISESDVSLAAVSDAIIIGFNVRPNTKVQEMASEENVDMRFHNVIYSVIKEIKDAIVGMMESTFEERIIGRAEVRQVFHIPKIGAIAGCNVAEGKVERGKNVRLLRDGVIKYEGKISSLRRYQDDVKEVQSGYECGIGIENYNDIKEGDTIDCYYLEEIKPQLD